MANNPPQKSQNSPTNQEKDLELGVYCDLFSAKTDVAGQDGGVVSALLASGLKDGLFDAVVVVGRGEGYSAEARVVTSPHEVYAAQGTKYLRVNVVEKLRELIGQGKKRIAIVCTPCAAKGVRKIQQTLKGDCEITIVGLFCYEAFNREKLKQQIATCLGIDLDKAEKTQIRHGKFTAQVEGKEYNCRVKDLNCAVERACLFCGDFAGEAADVSVGSVGSKKGYSTVIVRSQAGEELVGHLAATKETADRDEIAKLSKFKKFRAKTNLEALKKPT